MEIRQQVILLMEKILDFLLEGPQAAGSFVGASPAAAWVDAGVSRCNGGSGPCYVLGINNGRRTCGPFSTKGTEM